MTRVAMMVAMWFMLVGRIGDVVAAGSRHSVLALLALAVLVTVVTWAALWLQFEADGGEPRPEMVRARWHHG